MNQDPVKNPKLSIIIPARDEENFLPNCLKAINKAAEGLLPAPEIVLVLNRCSDRTEEIGLAAGAKVVRNDSKNLSQIRNTGAEASSGDYLITIDADSCMSPNMLRKIIQVLASAKVVGGGVLILPSRFSLGIFFTGLCILPVILYYRISGGLFFCRREAFFAIGGFDQNLFSAEDIDFARRLRAYGRLRGMQFKNIYSAYIRTSMRKFDKLGDWYFFKNMGLMFSLLKGKDRAGADKIWYDFER